MRGGSAAAAAAAAGCAWASAQACGGRDGVHGREGVLGKGEEGALDQHGRMRAWLTSFAFHWVRGLGPKDPG
jgi:hypothetical protein